MDPVAIKIPEPSSCWTTEQGKTWSDTLMEVAR
jgi:hypothetical protein